MTTVHETTMYRQGGQWIVSRWDESVGCYRTSQPMSYTAARQWVGEDNCPSARGGTCKTASHQHDRGER